MPQQLLDFQQRVFFLLFIAENGQKKKPENTPKYIIFFSFVFIGLMQFKEFKEKCVHSIGRIGETEGDMKL